MKHFPHLVYKDRSSLDFGLYIQTKGRYAGAERDVTYTGVPGRSGDLITDNGRYKNLNIPYTMALLNTEARPFGEIARAISGWLLSEVGYFRLWDSYDENYFRLASYKGEVNIEQELETLGSLSLTFSCKPYQYSFQGQIPIPMTAPGVLYNPEAFPAAPYMKLTGEGDVTLYIGGNSLQIKEIDGFIELDFELPNAYKGMTPQNHKVSGANLSGVRLLPGENSISWAGNVESLEIIPRWCCL